MNPYLLPNFHSISVKNNSLNSLHNRFAFTSQTDYNGCGLISGDVCAKHNTAANFYAKSPTLPYFINKSRLQNNFAAKNCLLYCKNKDKNLLLTTDEKAIIGLLIEDNKQIESGSRAQNERKHHIYSRDESVSYGPFRYCTQNVFDLYIDEEEEEFRPIFELKVHCDDDEESQIQSNSRNKICFYRFNCDNDSDLDLNQFNELKIESLRRNDDSLFESCERNQLIENQVLISYTTDNVIDLYDLETNEIIRSFSDTDPKDTEIGLQWTRSHPKFFVTGDHKRLQYCDSRSLKTVLEIFNKDNYNSFQWEMFYQFMPSKANSNQVFLATDYHIIVIDWRYPKKNLNQLNHMIPHTIIRNLKSLKVEMDGTNSELLVSSNFHRNCLMSFTCSPPLVPLTSKHLPIHLSIPKDIDKQFENYFYRGIELIDSTDSSGFSLAVLTNSGDIYIQDLFWITSDEEMNAREGDPLYRDRTFCSGIGSSTLELNEETVQYMDVLKKFLYNLKTEIKVEANYVKECLKCTLNRVCKIVDDECQCKNLPEFANAFKAIDPTPDPEAHRKAIIESLYTKHLGKEILKNKQRLEDKELLAKTTDKYTKNIFKVWGVLDTEDNMDHTQDDDIPAH